MTDIDPYQLKGESIMSEKKSFFDSGFMKGLRKFGEKLGANKFFAAIQAAFMQCMAVIMVGAIAEIVATVPALLGAWAQDSTIYKVLYAPYNLTFNMLSVWFLLFFAYDYAKAKGLKSPTGACVTALVCFFIVASPATIYSLASGSTVTALDISYLGGTGLFVAIIVGGVTVAITDLCIRKNIVIKMPDVVPPFLVDGFSAILPLLINVIIFQAISSGLSIATGGQLNFPLLITYVLAMPLQAIFNSVPGMLIVALFACLLWCFGIHGTMVAYIAVMSVMMSVLTQNANIYQQTLDPSQVPFQPILLFGYMACCGGTGNTTGLALLCLRSKSKQLNAVGKAAIVPSFFGINEPLTFGVPIMYNPVMAIPYILTPIVVMLLGWVGYATKLLQPSFIVISGLLPMGVGEFFSTLSWKNAIFPYLMIIVSYLIYRPFFKAYERELIVKEQAAAAAELSGAADKQ